MMQRSFDSTGKGHQPKGLHFSLWFLKRYGLSVTKSFAKVVSMLHNACTTDG